MEKKWFHLQNVFVVNREVSLLNKISITRVGKLRYFNTAMKKLNNLRGLH